MEKALQTKWTWTLVFIAVVGTVVFLTYKQQNNAQNYQRDRSKWCSAVPLSSKQEPSCQDEGPYRSDYKKWWYVLFTWPEGITTWAIIATGFAILWQGNETRRAAEATFRQADIARKALILQFRPRIRIRTIRIIESDDALSVKVVAFNKGGTPAHIKNGDVSFDWIFMHATKSHITTAHFDAATIPPGAEHTLDIPFSDHWMMYKFSVDDAEKRPDYPQMTLRCQGTIAYSDDTGITRLVGFSRKRLEKTKTWTIDTDPEYEYN